MVCGECERKGKKEKKKKKRRKKGGEASKEIQQIGDEKLNKKVGKRAGGVIAKNARNEAEMREKLQWIWGGGRWARKSLWWEKIAKRKKAI